MHNNSCRQCTFLCAGVVIFFAVVAQTSLVWVRKPQNRAAALGTDVILPCQAKWSGTNDTTVTLSYVWMLNGGNVTSRSSRFYNNSLFLSMVSLNELGNYSCIVTSQQHGDNGNAGHAQETSSATAMLIEAYLNDFIVDPEPVEDEVGEDAVLTCITGRSAPSLQVQWFRNGQVFTDGKVIVATYGDYDATGLSIQLSLKLVFAISSESVGQFQCVAHNEVLKKEVVSEPAYVTIKVNASTDAPEIKWNLPQSLIIAEGQHLLLPCEVKQTKGLTVVWYLGAYRVDASKSLYMLSNYSLVFVLVGPKDSGNYSCVARNSKGNTQSPYIELVVAFLGINFTRNPSNISAVHGQDIVLKCSPPESIPAATVTWYKNYMPINLQSNKIKVLDNNLYLTSVTKNDSGIYYCVASNNLTFPSSRTSKTATVKVQGPPIIIQPPQNTKVIKGELLHLFCQVDSDPTPNTTWLFEGRPLQQSDKVSVNNRGQDLWITNIGKEWQGLYTCLSRNSFGDASADTFVIVLVAPVSLKPIGSLFAVSGDAIVIPCPVVCDPMPVIQWFFNDSKVSIEGSIAALYNISWTYKYPNLSVEHILPQHAGKYTCVGLNDVGNSTSVGWLVVYVAPIIVQAPTNVTALIGTPFTLNCQAQGNPSPGMYWLYNSSLQLSDSVYLDNNNSTLQVAALNWKSVGSYTCVAHNVAGKVQATAIIKLSIAPKIEKIYFPQTPVRIHTSFNLSCIASGLPTPEVKWLHSGKPVKESLNGRVRLYDMGNIVVQAAWKNDSGQYDCWANSTSGQDKMSVTVVVYGKPSPPVLLQAIPSSSESVNLVWKWSDHGDAAEIVEKFDISFWEKSSEVSQVYRITPLKNETQIEILGLRPFTEYIFTVLAVNEAGSSLASNAISAITLQSHPSSPVNLKTSALTQTSATLTWEVPTYQNGVVRLYELKYKKLTDIQKDYSYMNITDPQFPSNDLLLSPLLPYSHYEAQVRACNIDRGQNLWGNYSSVTFHTLASKPSLPPQLIRVHAVDQYDLIVNWQQIPELAMNGLILFYHINVKNNNSQPLVNVRVNASVTSYTITGLFPWRYYSVTVEGENKAGLGPVSDPVGAMTLPLAPMAPPGNFQVTATSASSIHFSWQALQGDLVTCNITVYQVQYRKLGSLYWDSLSLPSNSTLVSFLYTLKNLEPWTWYECQVAAFCSTMISGIGPFTDPVSVQTSQGVSSPVTSLSYKVNSTCISLSWQPSKDIRGVLIGYRVRFTAVTSVNTSGEMEINTTTTSALLLNLCPQTDYNISVAAVNSAGRGQELTLRVTTLVASPSTYLPFTSDSTMFATNTASNNTEHSLGQSNNGDITKHLASIVAGSIVGAIALIVATIVICIKCMKYRQKQRLNYDVDSDTTGVEGTAYRTLEPSPDISTISSNISIRATDSSPSTTVIQSSYPSQSALFDDNGVGENLDTQRIIAHDKEGKRKLSIHHPSLPILSQSSPYSMLQEDNNFTNYGAKGFDNPGFIEVKVDLAEDVSAEVNLRHHRSRQHFYVVKDDTLSVSSDTLRRNRMHSENAAAIAVMRSSQTLFPDDTDLLMESIGAEVIFNERTVL